MSALLTIVRHGETAANTDGVWHGSTDTPLSERGHRQAAAVGAHLAGIDAGFSVVYSSPLQRARHTAEAIAQQLALDIEFDPSLSPSHGEDIPYLFDYVSGENNISKSLIFFVV